MGIGRQRGPAGPDNSHGDEGVVPDKRTFWSQRAKRVYAPVPELPSLSVQQSGDSWRLLLPDGQYHKGYGATGLYTDMC